jgi:ubiquinone biosynthesis protein UbiJ
VREFEAREYLEHELPALLANAKTGLARNVVIQWIVVDREDCDLAYRISEKGIEIGYELADDVDLTIAFVSDDLCAFSERKLDVARALRTRRLKIDGDETLLSWMAARL